MRRPSTLSTRPGPRSGLNLWKSLSFSRKAGTPCDRNPISAQRLIEVRDQVVRVLEPDREPNEVLRRLRARAFARGAMLDQALDGAERRGAHEELRLSDRGERRLAAGPD